METYKADLETILNEWEYSGYAPAYKELPESLREQIAVGLFKNTPADGYKGDQDEILTDLFDTLNIKQLYALGFLPEDWIQDEYESQAIIQESDDYDFYYSRQSYDK